MSSDSELLSLNRKRGLNQGAAVEFVNNKLGECCISMFNWYVLSLA